MSVIIIILKVLGILLLTVIGVLLLLLFLLLFYPVYYRAEGVSEEKWNFKGNVCWLFHIVSFSLSYDGEETDTVLKICGIRMKKKEAGQTEDFEESVKPDEEQYVQKTPSLSAMSIEPETDALRAEETVKDAAGAEEPEKDAAGAEETVKEEKKVTKSNKNGRKDSSPKKADKDKKRRKRFRFKEKQEELLQKCREILRRIKDTVCNFWERVADIKGKLSDETNQKAFSYIWKELVYLLKHMRFRRLKTAITFSVGDPAATGQVLGVLSIFPFLYQYDINIYPDFMAEKTYISGTFQVKGYLRLIHVLISVIRLFIRKECRILWKRILK